MGLKLKEKAKATKPATDKKKWAESKGKAKPKAKATAKPAAKAKKKPAKVASDDGRGRAAGWSNTSSYKSIWHLADEMFKKHPKKDNKEIFALMDPIVKKHFKQSRFSTKNVTWYKAKYNAGIHPKR